METIKKYWWVIVALIVGCFVFKKRKTIKRRFKRTGMYKKGKMRISSFRKKRRSKRRSFNNQRGDSLMALYRAGRKSGMSRKKAMIMARARRNYRD